MPIADKVHYRAFEVRGASQMRQQGRLTVKRRGLASVLFGIFQPTHFRAASVDDDALALAFSLGSVKIPLGEIDAVETQVHWRWHTVRIRSGRRHRPISGLSRHDAGALVDALDGARICWWRQALDRRADTIESICARLEKISNPSTYSKKREFSDLKLLAGSVGRHFLGRWPEQLAQASEIVSLKAIRNFLDDPERFRKHANTKYIENELKRSRALFDRIEARPLTDEQRKAVVLDEERNLVVAAAGSGKTSVIVAKAAWLVRRGFRDPSELLLLAFAKDAQQELRERVIGRVGKEAARDISVRTFFPWYNTEHRHGGIAMLTPDDVHHHRTRSVLDQRGRTLQAAWTRHPERFVRGVPKPDPLPEAVWINPPVTSTTGESAQ